MKTEDTPFQEAQDQQHVLEERARALAAAPLRAEEETDRLELVTFGLGEERYGVEVDFVVDVQPLESHAWSRVPCTPDFIVGAVNIRGHIYSMMNLAPLLGLPNRSPSENAHVIVVGSKDRGTEKQIFSSILTEDVPEVTQVPISDLLPPPSASLAGEMQPYVSAVTAEMLTVLDLERLLSDTGIIIHEEV